MSLDLSRLQRPRPQSGKTIAQCPACAEAGNDSKSDHLFINADGAFGCVIFPGDKEHRRRIIELAGVEETKVLTEKSEWTALPSAPRNAPAPALTHPDHGTPAKLFTYQTDDGRLAGFTARFETAKGKETRPIAWCRDQHGNTGWRWKMQPNPRTLYGLPVKDRAVVIVEGEKTADAVMAAGLPAVTWQGGASSSHQSDWSPLTGKVCFIWPDNDKPGLAARDQIVSLLAGKVAEIRLIQIPHDAPAKWDAADAPPELIRQLVDEAVPLDPADYPQPEVAAEASTTAANPLAFTFHRADDLSGPTEAMDFVENLLTDGGASVVYGPSNCGKSFWTVDLAVSVSTGQPFRDELEVEQGAVVYVALEGSHGARNRVEALKLTGRLKPGAPFFLVFESVSLLEAGHDKRLAETIAQVSEQAGMPVKLVILDTMARAMAGGDENSGQDMTAAVATIDAVRAATGAHVLVVHHCGKDEARGARGHSSLRAAVDTEIEVFRPEGETVSTVRVTKQRDLEKGEPMPFSLEVVKVGENRRGKDITSCVVRHEDEFMAAQPAKKGRPPSATREELLSLLPQPSTSAWQRKANDEFGISKSAFHRMIPNLQGHGALRGTEGQWVAA